MVSIRAKEFSTLRNSARTESFLLVPRTPMPRFASYTVSVSREPGLRCPYTFRFTSHGSVGFSARTKREKGDVLARKPSRDTNVFFITYAAPFAYTSALGLPSLNRDGS